MGRTIVFLPLDPVASAVYSAMLVNEDAEPGQQGALFQSTVSPRKMLLELFCIFRSAEASVIEVFYANVLWKEYIVTIDP